MCMMCLRWCHESEASHSLPLGDVTKIYALYAYTTTTLTLRHCKRVHIVVLVVPKRGGGVLGTPSSDAPHSYHRKGIPQPEPYTNMFSRSSMGQSTFTRMKQEKACSTPTVCNSSGRSRCHSCG